MGGAEYAIKKAIKANSRRFAHFSLYTSLKYLKIALCKLQKMQIPHQFFYKAFTN